MMKYSKAFLPLEGLLEAVILDCHLAEVPEDGQDDGLERLEQGGVSGAVKLLVQLHHLVLAETGVTVGIRCNQRHVI